MLLNHFKTAWRLLQKYAVHSLINILGLGVGFSVATLLLIYVYHQVSYDRFHEHSDRIFRLTVEGQIGEGQHMSGPFTTGCTADVLHDQVPDMEHISRIYSRGADIFIDEQRFTGHQTAWVDTAFFEMFTFPLYRGDPNAVLSDPFSIVLTRETAEKFFGTDDAVDKTLTVMGRDYRITGIAENFPQNSHMHFDLFASFYSLVGPDYNVITNQGISFPTYILMREDTDRDRFIQTVLDVADENINDVFSFMGITLSHGLQPLENVYLHSRFIIPSEETGDIRNVYIFSFLTFFILLIAIFNYVNLMTAQAEKRSREIGLRKVIGATRGDLIRQFMGESAIVALVALAVALLLNELLIGPFSQMLGEDFSLLYWQHPWMLAAILAFVLLTGILSGVYPAFYLSRHKPVTVLKGDQHGTGKPMALRKLLVSLQFAISIFLIASLLLVHRQVSQMKHKDPGFEREHVISVHNLTGTLRNSYESIKAELLQYPDILHVTASESIPGRQRSVQNCYRQGDDPKNAIMIHENRVQHDYIQTFGMQLIEGRDFDPGMRTDTAAFILNEKAVRQLGLEDPVGTDVFVWQQPGRVIGVVSDFHFQSLHHPVEPLVFSMYSEWFSNISIRVEQGQLPGAKENIRNVFENADPGYVFTYLFMDEIFNAMYRREEQVSKMITAAAIIAIVISFMGLFALTSFTIRQKVKEIGIRKTFGAPVSRVVLGLMVDLSRWLMAGAIIGLPAAWFIVARWQENFAYQISLAAHWWIFLLAILLAGGIGSMAMLYQSVAAARANPIDSLRTE